MTIAMHTRINPSTASRMETLLSTTAVNAAFLLEVKQVHHELWAVLAELHEILARPLPVAVNPQHLLRLFGQLRDGLALLFTLEEAYGYFDDPVRVSPQCSHEAMHLRSQHRELYLEISQLVEHVERHYDRRELADWIVVIAGAFMRFHRRLQIHEARENALIQQAYDEDLGGGD